MLKLPKKLMITLMATATVLGVGTGIGQLPSASARHVRTYRVRRRRTYRHRRTARRLTKRARRTKRTKRTKRIRYTKRARRSARKYRRYHLVYRAAKAHKPKRSRRYVRKHARRRVVRRAPRLQNMFSEFSKAQLQHMANLDHEPLNAFKQDAYINSGKHIYGPAKAYNMDAFYMIFTKPGLAYYAKMNNEPVATALRKEVKHATKYWYWNGNPTKLALQIADRDAINDLNRDREAAGVQPLTPDPGLQLVAEKRAQQTNDQFNNSNQMISHTDSHNNSYAEEIAEKYNTIRPDGENIAGPDVGAGAHYTKPSEMAKEENHMWDPAHEGTRMSPAFNYVGISMNGSTAEDFA